MDTTNCVKDLINSYPDWEGAKVLQLLIQHTDTDIFATVVELCLQNTIPPLEAENLRYHLAPIKMTDEATLKAVKKRLNQLIAQLARQHYCHSGQQFCHSGLDPESIQIDSCLRSNDSPASTILVEIQALTAYIRETTLPTGAIKCFNDDDTKAYRRQSAAIRRLLAQAIKDGHHEAVATVKASLKKGKIMRWERVAKPVGRNIIARVRSVA